MNNIKEFMIEEKLNQEFIFEFVELRHKLGLTQAQMADEYHNYWFHIKGFFIGETLALIICSLSGLIIHFFL